MLYFSAGGVIIGPEGKIVVVNQNRDSWSLPKGGIEPGENELDAAKREIYEETGLTDITVLEKLGDYVRPTIGKGGLGEGMSHMKHITFYLCRTTQTELKPIDLHNPEAVWLDPSEVEDKLVHPKDKEFFRSCLPKIQALLS
ncbi:MAG: NUDIX hydrolase [bacterium]|nr:NUDIX hydrolase [bacterium]